MLEESILALLLLALLLGEVFGGGRLLKSLLVNTANVYTLAGGDHVAGVNSSEGNAIDLEGTGDKENTLVEVLEEDDTLATESTSEEDQNSTGLEAFAELRGTDSLADLLQITQR